MISWWSHDQSVKSPVSKSSTSHWPHSVRAKMLSTNFHMLFISSTACHRGIQSLPHFICEFKAERMQKEKNIHALQSPPPPLSSLFLPTSSQYASIPPILCQMKICENIAQGGPLPKRDIVDTYTHASCAIGPNITKQTYFPTTWGKAERTKVKGLVRHENQVTVESLYDLHRTVSNVLNQLSVIMPSNTWTAGNRSLKRSDGNAYCMVWMNGCYNFVQVGW